MKLRSLYIPTYRNGEALTYRWCGSQSALLPSGGRLQTKVGSNLTQMVLCPGVEKRQAEVQSFVTTMLLFWRVLVIFFRDVVEPQAAEILACRSALQVARERGILKVHLELDSKGLVQMIKDKQKNLAAVGPWIQEIKGLLHTRNEFKIS